MQQSARSTAAIALLLTSSPIANALSISSIWPRWAASEHQLKRRNTTEIPAAINIAPSQYWDGDDGPWSSFALQIGMQVQNTRQFISTSENAVITVSPDGCPSFYPADCSDLRGGFYNINDSATYVPHDIYNVGTQKFLGNDIDAYAGYDTVTLGWQGSGAPAVEHTVVFNTASSIYWLGLFGINPRPVNFTTYGDPVTSFMGQLVQNDSIPSSSWGYTAGNQYRLNKVYGSLVLGGYDANRFAPTDVSFPFDEDNSLDLSVNVQSITTNGGKTNLLPDGQIRVFLDAGVSQLWLPESACAAFEEAFGLTYDNTSNFYLVNNSLHTTLTQQNPSVTFTLSPNATTGGETVDITLPYGAFDLQVTFPNVMNPNTSYYFPLKRAQNSTQYIFGRTFFQEAYVIADYDRRNFTVAPCTWDQNQISSANIKSILRANETNIGDDSSDSGISTGAIVGIVVGVVLGVVVVLGAALFFIRRKKAEKKRQAAELEAKNSEDSAGASSSKPFISAPIGGELGADGEVHELTAPHKPFAQEMESPYRLDPNKAGYAEMEGGEYFGPGKGHAAEVQGSMPIFEMPGSEVQEMPTPEHRPVDKPQGER